VTSWSASARTRSVSSHARCCAAAVALSMLVAPPASAQGGGVLVVARGGQLWAFEHGRDSDRGYGLFSGPGADRHPVVSVDGKLAFDRQLPGGAATVYVASPGTAPRPLVTGGEPAFSTLGGRVAFVGFRGLFTIRVSGTHLRRVTARRGDRNPSWGSNGLIAFERTRGAAAGIYVVRPDGSGLRRIVQSPLRLADPAWSPDGQTLLVGFEADGAGCREVSDHPNIAAGRAKIEAEYSVIITSANGCHAANAWAPGGRAVAVSAGRHLALQDLDEEQTGVICNASVLDGVAWASDRAGGWLVGDATRGRAERWSTRHCPGIAPETERFGARCAHDVCDRAKHTTTVCVHWHGKKYCWTVKR
jgi:hypothetical protein